MKKALPLPGLIVIRPSVIKPATEYIEVEAVQSNQEGEVLAVGEGVTLVKEGEMILHKRFAGSHVEVNGEVLVFLTEADLLAHVETQVLVVAENRLITAADLAL